MIVRSQVLTHRLVVKFKYCEISSISSSFIFVVHKHILAKVFPEICSLHKFLTKNYGSVGEEQQKKAKKIFLKVDDAPEFKHYICLF